MHVLIPAYQPNESLTQLVRDLLAARPSLNILIVNDGSAASCAEVFDDCSRLGADVLRLGRNQGKGFALRAGFRYLLDNRAAGAVATADADGQHAVGDILRVLDEVDVEPQAAPHLVVGERAFDGDVPLRSRFGNAVTRQAFRAVSGTKLVDTQTGLRAMPSSLLEWLVGLHGDRYEYELHMLLHAVRDRVELRSVQISTIYLDDNESSHFRPLVDSARIYAPLLKFAGSSLAGFVVDTVMLLVLNAVLGMLLPAVVLARLISASVNYSLNRELVFAGNERGGWQGSPALRYLGLAAGLLGANYFMLVGLVGFGVPLLVAKVITEAALVIASYVIQARFVFAKQAREIRAQERPGGEPLDQPQDNPLDSVA